MSRTSKNRSQMSPACPCGSGHEFDNCCGPIIATHSAATAEQLMRSRYSAYVKLDRDYLLATWHPEFRPANLQLSAEQRWLGLSIKGTEAGQSGDTHGVVEFVARYKIAGRGHRLHEISRFECLDGQWFYCDGTFPEH